MGDCFPEIYGLETLMGYQDPERDEAYQAYWEQKAEEAGAFDVSPQASEMGDNHG